MIITTNDLNNIETSLTTPVVKGIFYINNNNGTLDCTYNQIIEQLQLGNLPVIKIQDNNRLVYNFIIKYYSNNNNIYRISCMLNSYEAEQANEYLEVMQYE